VIGQALSSNSANDGAIRIEEVGANQKARFIAKKARKEAA
jgi:hypothetical protein